MPASDARRTAWAILAVTAAMAALLLAMGREPFCPCGEILLWDGDRVTPKDSQQFTDWFTLSHIVHGLIFFGLLSFAARHVSWLAPVGRRAVLAAVIEAAWEVFENSGPVIAGFRAEAAAVGFIGDSVLNSVGDMGAMVLGFFIANAIAPALSVALAILLELVALIVIRDNMTLIILNALFPVDAIRQWQAGG